MKKIEKKSLFKILSIILCTALIITASFGGYLLYRFNCNKSGVQNSYNAVYEADQIRLSTDENGIFRILKINDTHMFNGICEGDKKTLKYLKEILDNTPCNFIILDGDIVDGFNLKLSYDKYNAFRLIAELIEEYNIPWSFAPGNNDFEIDGSNEDIISFLMQYNNFVYGNAKSLEGSMQFVAEVYNADKLVHCVAIMDSGARKPKAIGSYQPITKAQAEWLDEQTESRNVPTSVFFHMPTNAFQEAFEKGKAYEGFDMYNTYPYDSIKDDNILDNIIENNHNITLISCAHQHSNNMCSFFNGRYYQLSSVSGYSADYRDFITPSCTLTTIDTNNINAQTMYKFEQIADETHHSKK